MYASTQVTTEQSGESAPRKLQIFWQNGKWGFIDKMGNVVIPFKCEEIWNFEDGLAYVRLNGKWVYIDKTGKVVGEDN